MPIPIPLSQRAMAHWRASRSSPAHPETLCQTLDVIVEGGSVADEGARVELASLVDVK